MPPSQERVEPRVAFVRIQNETVSSALQRSWDKFLIRAGKQNWHELGCVQLGNIEPVVYEVCFPEHAESFILRDLLAHLFPIHLGANQKHMIRHVDLVFHPCRPWNFLLLASILV